MPDTEEGAVGMAVRGSTQFLELMLTVLLILLSENAGSAGIRGLTQLIASHRSLRLLIFILSFFFYSSNGIISVDLFFSLLILSLIISNMLLESSYEFFISITYSVPEFLFSPFIDLKLYSYVLWQYGIKLKLQ